MRVSLRIARLVNEPMRERSAGIFVFLSQVPFT